MESDELCLGGLWQGCVEHGLVEDRPRKITLFTYEVDDCVSIAGCGANIAEEGCLDNSSGHFFAYDLFILTLCKADLLKSETVVIAVELSVDAFEGVCFNNLTGEALVSYREAESSGFSVQRARGNKL